LPYTPKYCTLKRGTQGTVQAPFSVEMDCSRAFASTSMFGGKGSIAGTIIGLLIIGVLANGLVLLNMNPFWILIVKGVILLIAISASSVRHKMSDIFRIVG
jgi:ribose transport system permease protein